MTELKVGTVVGLRSGGPRMTVFELGEDGMVSTQWFDEYELRMGRFHKDELIVCAG